MTAIHAAIAPEKKPASACKRRQSGYARSLWLSESAGWFLRSQSVDRCLTAINAADSSGASPQA